MPLTKVQIAPGFNKQVTATGAEGKWTDGDFVRFRYGLPEKIGGWEQLVNASLVGAAREQFVWADLDGRRYAAIGTNKVLIIYYEDAFYDITPLGTAITGCTFSTVNTSATVTVNKAAHTLQPGDLFTFTSVTPPVGAGYTASNFETNTFQVVTVPDSDSFTITMASAAGTTVNGSGSATVNPYISAGALGFTYGFGWGTGLWGGGQQVFGTLNGLLQDDTAGTGGSGTSITLVSTTGFPTSGTIKVGTEFISYTGISTNDLTGITRGVAGTRSAHASGSGVEYYTGWGQASLVGAAREQFVWADLDGRRYAAIGTNKVLIIYYEDAFYDITPLGTAITGCTFSTVNTSATVTVNKAAHTLQPGDLFTFTSVTPPVGAGYTASNFETNTFQVVTVPDSDSFTITMASAAGTTVNGSGSATVNPYISAGALGFTYGFGWGTGLWGGGQQVFGTLNGLLQDDTAGTGGSGTSITLVSTTGFPTSGTIKVGTEFISYTGISTNDLTGITRGVAGTRSAHASGSGVEYYTGWGQASLASTLTIDPASWSLDNFGERLIATIKNGKTFQWNPINSNPNALTTRATVVSGAPTASVMSLVSDRDRHLLMLGTETTVGSGGTQDKMFIRFSDQENTSDYTPTSVNTAGTFRLDSGTKIVGAVKGKDYTLVLTDNSAYVIQFVGPPFTFSIRQVGSNCGAIGQHSIKYVNGAVY